MGSNVATVTDGKIENTSITDSKVKNIGSTSLGKDAFLQLLVAQMKYQDPLEPSSDTEWIAQLAQFSSLEEMQNMNSTMSNTQAFTMVGKVVQVENSKTSDEGVVDYVTISGSTAYVNVNGNSYKASDVKAVLGEDYLQSTYGPKVPNQTATYDYDNSADVKFSVSMGQDGYKASGMYVAVDGKLVDQQYLSYDEKNEILTISQSGLQELIPGKTYDVTLIFDDVAQTTISGNAKIKVIGSKPQEDTEQTPDNGEQEDKTENPNTQA